MKGIMHKRLLGLLSVVGLSSSSTPASTQVLKGSKPADTKAESTIKASKTAQEDAASKDAAKVKKVANKRKAGGIQQDDKRKNAKIEHENAAAAAEAKGKLSSAEGGHATSDVVTQKRRKAGAESSVQDIHIKKAVKGTAETNAVQSGIQHKGQKAAVGAARGEANKKVDQASPK